MRKSFIMCGIILGMCTNVYAYENAACGFSVKEGNPMLVIETADTFAFSNYSVKNFDSILKNDKIDTYTAIRAIDKKIMSNVLGTTFSTSLFNKELEKIALNKENIEVKKLSKFANQSIYINTDKELFPFLYNNGNKEFEEEFEENTKVAVVKTGKGKALEFSNYFSTKGNNYAVKTTVISDNDRIYTLSTIGPELDIEDSIANDTSKDSKIEVNEGTGFISLDEKDFDSTKVKKFKADHTKTLKSFKTFVPTSKKHVFGYTDTVTKKFVELPQDWFYVKGNLVETAGNGHIYFAANTEEIKNAIKDVIDYRTQKVGQNVDMTDKQYEDCLNLTLKNINQAKLALTVTMADNELKGMFGQPLQTKIFVDQMLKQGFRRAKEFSTPYFKLEDYDYNTWFSETNGKVNIDLLATLCKAYTYKGIVKSEFSAKTNTGNLTFDITKNKTVGKTIQFPNSEPANITNRNKNIQ